MDRIAYRRMLSDMSHRHVTLAQLGESSGVRRQEVRAFIEMLQADGLLVQREAPAPAPDSFFDTLRPIGGWFRRAWAAEPVRR
jgi:predicted ArsR family transcriptional regulator